MLAVGRQADPRLLHGFARLLVLHQDGRPLPAGSCEERQVAHDDDGLGLLVAGPGGDHVGAGLFGGERGVELHLLEPLEALDLLLPLLVGGDHRDLQVLDAVRGGALLEVVAQIERPDFELHRFVIPDGQFHLRRLATPEDALTGDGQ